MENTRLDLEHIDESLSHQADDDLIAYKQRKLEATLKRKSNRKASLNSPDPIHHLPDVQHGHAGASDAQHPIRRNAPRGS